MDIKRLIRSGWVRRWHSDENGMSDCGEENAEHQWTTCMIALRLDPLLSRGAIIYALTHDVGELGVGDLPHGFKRASTDIAESHKKAELRNRLAILGHPVAVTQTIDRADLDTVKLADQIAAYAVVLRHRPHLAQSSEWRLWRDHLPPAAQEVVDEIAI
jgi:5'-deoxynucleotidase YfbR-like HD superfamily hydrolase